VGFLTDAKKTLSTAVDKHGDKISEGLDKAGAAIDARTGGKYRDKIDAGVGKAKTTLDGLDGRRDDFRATSGGSQPPEPSADPPGNPSTQPGGPTGPTGPSDPSEPTAPTEPTAPSGPMSSTGGDSDPVPTDPSPVPPEPGADPNEDIAARTRPVPSGGPR
jgi:hypothetical protein